MCNSRRHAWHDMARTVQIIERVAIMYMHLMRLGVDVFTKDPVLMSEWNRFTLNYPHQVSKALE